VTVGHAPSKTLPTSASASHGRIPESENTNNARQASQFFQRKVAAIPACVFPVSVSKLCAP